MERKKLNYFVFFFRFSALNDNKICLHYITIEFITYLFLSNDHNEVFIFDHNTRTHCGQIALVEIV